MRQRFRNAPMLLAVPLLATLIGCAGSKGIPGATVAIPDDCEKILQHPARPEVRVGDDLRALTARHRAELAKRDAAIDAGRECIAGVRQRYGEGR